MGLGRSCLLRQKGSMAPVTTSSCLERRKVGPGWAFPKCLSTELTLPLLTSPTQGPNIEVGAPSMLWNTSRCPIGLPYLQNDRNVLLWIYLLEFQVASREQTLHSIEFKASKFSLKIQPPLPTQSWISVSKARLDLTSLLAGNNHTAACSTCLQNFC